MTDRDRSTVIMAIRPQYVDAIMAGVKLWEFRRKPLPDAVRTILPYRSGPAEGRGVLGILDVTGQSTTSPDAWGRGPRERGYGHARPDPLYGISIDALADYGEQRGPYCGTVTGIRVKVARQFPEPVPLSAYGVTSSPQSWVYAPVGWRGVA